MARAHLAIVLLATFAPLTAAAQQPLSDAAIARETSDPTSQLWLLFSEFAYSNEPSKGARTANRFTWELQPTIPISLTSSWRLLNFPELVFTAEEIPRRGFVGGLQNFSWFTALAQNPSSFGLAWGVGPYASFPVSSDQDLEVSQWQFGGGAVVSLRRPEFVISGLLKTGWTTSNTGEEAGSMQLQYNFQHFFGDGYQVGLGRPTITYTWNRDGVGTWDIPIGVDVAKVFHIGRLPVKIMLEYDFQRTAAGVICLVLSAPPDFHRRGYHPVASMRERAGRGLMSQGNR